MKPEEQLSLSVSELNHFIKQVLNAGFPETVWVCGEIQGYNRSREKKHVFFDLCETDADSKSVLARIGLVIFSNRKAVINRILSDNGNAFELKDDIEVKFLCKIDFYPPHGSVRLIVEEIDPFYTLGKMAVEKQRLILMLKKNGTLDKNKQLFISDLPLRVGLITSFDSAAYNDFISELTSSHFKFSVIYRNTLMQGKAAEQDICRGLDEFYRHQQEIDVIVVTRGGGSMADLSCFDSRRIAEQIALSPVPVLSGIGHEIDLTVTDLAAHTYQKTPTAIAQFLVSMVQDTLEKLDDERDQLLALVRQKIEEDSDVLRRRAQSMHSAIRDFLKDHEREISRIEDCLKREPRRNIEQAFQDFKRQRDTFFNLVEGFLKRKKESLFHARRLIDASHPDQICKKGFSITRTVDGKLVRSLSDVSGQQAITTFLNDGCIDSSIIKLIPNEEADHG